MDVVTGIDRLRPDQGRLFVVVGVFDGLHRGHRYLLGRLRTGARGLGARPAVVTFDAHPDEVIVGAAPPLLCDPDERLARLAAAGVEVTVVQHFDDALRATPFDAFVAAIASRVELAGFLMTPDAAFGHERRGTPEALAELGVRTGFEVVVAPPFELDERPVRSGTVRVDIAAGDLNGARRLLGRPVAVAGVVEGVPGAGSGNGSVRLRFPVPVALPPEGLYRATVEPAWSTVGRVGPPVRSRAEVTAEGLTLYGGGPVEEGSRLRVAFTASIAAPGSEAR